MDLIYWLMLLKVPGIGVRKFYKILKIFEEPYKVFNSNTQKLRNSGIFNNKSLDFIATINQDIVLNDIKWQQQKDCYIITLIDENYPDKLKQIIDPPPVLYIRGNLSLINKRQLAIVGSRNPTTTGTDIAYNFAKQLSSSIIITSGMAVGIDSSAHLGALSANNPTIAVCGTGLDRIYPASSKNIAKQIAISGALISELPIGTPPMANNFPKRNRIITGLSDALLVVEASIKSGSMISAKTALEQNRDIFAIPGSIKNPLTAGTHQLIKDGAMLTDNITDITTSLNLTDKNIIIKNHKDSSINDNVILKYINYDGITVDALAEKSGLSVQDVINQLLELELINVVEKLNNTYILR